MEGESSLIKITGDQNKNVPSKINNSKPELKSPSLSMVSDSSQAASIKGKMQAIEV